MSINIVHVANKSHNLYKRTKHIYKQIICLIMPIPIWNVDINDAKYLSELICIKIYREQYI